MDGAFFALRVFFLVLTGYGVIAWLRVRDKPADWVPPRWETWRYLGPVDRDRYKLNAALSVIGGSVLIAFTFLLEDLVRSP